jgi:hypothetical protein
MQQNWKSIDVDAGFKDRQALGAWMLQGPFAAKFPISLSFSTSKHNRFYTQTAFGTGSPQSLASAR